MLNRLKIGSILIFWAAIAPLLMGAQGNTVLPTTGTVSGLTMTSNTNAALAAINSCNSGASAPTNGVGGVAVQGQCWLDTSGAFPVVKIYDGASWVTRDVVDTTNHVQWDKNGPVATTSGTNSFTLTTNYGPAALVDGASVCFRIGTTNTSSTTLAPNALTAHPLRSSPSVEFASGVLVSGSVYCATYRLASTEWIAQGFYTITSSQQVPPGSEFIFSGFTAPAGFFLEYGQAVSRTTYAALLAVETTVMTGNRTSGSAVISSISSTTDLSPGWPVEGTGIPSSTTIKSVDSATQITLSANASSGSSTSTSLTFFPHGNGDGSTTFNLPDWRGYTPVGQDNQGGTAASVLQKSTTLTTVNGSAICSGSGCVVGSSSGLAVGMYIIAVGVPAGTTIASIIDGTHITLSAAATASGTVTARFSPVYDAQGVGQTGGELAHTQSASEVGNHTHGNGSLTVVGGDNVGHSCSSTTVDINTGPSSAVLNVPRTCANNTITLTVGGSTGGSGTALPGNTMQKSKVTKFIIKY